MRRVLLLAILAVVSSVALQGSALAGGAGIVGGGSSDPGFATGSDVQFDVSARSGPQGDFGKVVVRQSIPGVETTYLVDVNCVNVFAPNFAAVSGTVTRANPVPGPVEPGNHVLYAIGDGGNPSSAGPVDAFYTFEISVFPIDCHFPPFTGGVPNVTKGNIVIRSG